MSRLTRPRLTGRLAKAARYPIVAIVAAAGFGKSVALRDFLQTERIEHVRYDVRADHRTLLEFVRGFAKAVESSAPGALASFADAQARAIESKHAPLELALWMLEHVHAVKAIVLDDLHHIDGDLESTTFVRELIERSADDLRWIIASRSELGLPIASWIAYEKMDLPVREADLCFTLSEALAAAQDANVGEERAQELLRLTDGWPVAFSIALRSATAPADLPVVTDGTREVIYRYLAEQVFARLSPQEREFLLQTSVYAWLDSQIIERRGDAPELLGKLRREAGFIYAASESELRYHDLFRDFLENELRARGEAAWAATVCAAAEVLEMLDRNSEALVLYQRANATADLVRLLESRGFDLLDRGRTEVVETSINGIPDAQRRAHSAIIGIEAAIAARRGNADLAEDGYRLALERATKTAQKAEIAYRYAIDLVRADRNAEAIALLEPHADSALSDTALRASLLATLASAHVQAGNAAAAKQYIERGLTLLERSPEGTLRARIYQRAAYVMLRSGDVDRARQYASTAVELAERQGLYDLAARAYSVLYNITNDVDDDPISSLRFLEALEACARKGGSAQMRVFAVVAVFDIAVERGDDATIGRLEMEIDSLEASYPQAVINALLPARALQAAWKKEFAEAYELLGRTASAQQTAERRALRWAEIAVYALAAGLRDEGDAALNQAYGELAQCEGVNRRLLRTRIFIALGELLRGRDVAANRLLHEVEKQATAKMPRIRALVRPALLLYGRLFGGNYNDASFEAALERVRAENLGGLARLLETLPLNAISNRGLGQLTSAEQQILRALAGGASSKAIAAQSGRSPQTVDVHIRSICRKLGCSGRIEAIALAVQSGWVS